MTAASTEHAGITATEAKTMTLAEWHVPTPRADPASGTSTDSWSWPVGNAERG